MSNYLQQCKRPDCEAYFDGHVKSDYCSDECEASDAARRKLIGYAMLGATLRDTDN